MRLESSALIELEDEELLELRLVNSSLSELDEVEVLELYDSLAFLRAVAPSELLEIEASCTKPELTAELSPSDMASTIARMRLCISAWLVEAEELVELVLDALLEEEAPRAVESRVNMSSWEAERSLFERSEPS